jgi:hypothetical protein
VFPAESLDFNVHARRQIELHQRVNRVGDRKTVQRLMTVGRGIGPATSAPVRFAVSTISFVD